MNADAEAEAGLLARCLEGEADAWNALFDIHYGATGRFVFQLGSDLSWEDVEEICQETFISVVRALPTFDRRARFQTWLFRIAANKARDYRERQRAAKRGGGQRPLSLNAEDPETGLVIDPPSPAAGPEARLLEEEDGRVLRAALDEMGDPCREVLELRYFADLGYDDISNLLGINAKTVSSRLSKCLDRLEEIGRKLLRRENSAPFSV